jgi:hypothetical protein
VQAVAYALEMCGVNLIVLLLVLRLWLSPDSAAASQASSSDAQSMGYVAVVF